MKLAIFNRAYESIRLRFSCIRPRLPGVFLVSVVYGVPVYALIWYSGLIDDLSVRLLLSVLVAMMPVAELLSAPKPWKSRGDLLFFALFIVLVSLFAIGHKFNLPVLSLNAAMLVAVLLWCPLVWQLMGGSLLLLTGLILAMVVMMIYWVAAFSGVGGWLEILILPLPTVLFGGVFWAPVARWILAMRRTTERVPIERPRDAGARNGHLVFPRHSGCRCRSLDAGTQPNLVGCISNYRWCPVECGNFGPIEAILTEMGKPCTGLTRFARTVKEYPC